MKEKLEDRFEILEVLDEIIEINNYIIDDPD